MQFARSVLQGAHLRHLRLVPIRMVSRDSPASRSLRQSALRHLGLQGGLLLSPISESKCAQDDYPHRIPS
jgi:hypothetical protein